MGLDMYLYAEAYTSQYSSEDLNKEIRKLFSKHVTDITLGSISVRFEVGYWRKANQIHNWFVQNCQDGIDECKESYVSRSHLEELLKICEEVKASLELTPGKVNDGHTMEDDGKGGYNQVPILVDGMKVVNPDRALELLPPSQGFFFGSSDIDEYYAQDIDDTIEILTKALALDSSLFEFSYRASW
jgi:hypothetical protein